MAIGHGLYNCKPQPRAPGLPSARTIDPIEPLEHLGEVLGRNPFTGILDTQHP